MVLGENRGIDVIRTTISEASGIIWQTTVGNVGILKLVEKCLVHSTKTILEQARLKISNNTEPRFGRLVLNEIKAIFKYEKHYKSFGDDVFVTESIEQERFNNKLFNAFLERKSTPAHNSNRKKETMVSAKVRWKLMIKEKNNWT